MEVSGAGSCPRTVNKERFWRVTVGARGKIGQLSLCPPHSAELEQVLHQAFVYVIPGHFSTVYATVWGPFGVTDVRSTREAEGLFLRVQKLNVTPSE